MLDHAIFLGSSGYKDPKGAVLGCQTCKFTFLLTGVGSGDAYACKHFPNKKFLFLASCIDCSWAASYLYLLIIHNCCKIYTMHCIQYTTMQYTQSANMEKDCGLPSKPASII